MSDNKEAGRLILADLKMFNAAVELFEQEIYPAILEAMGEAIQNWAEKHDWYVADSVDEDSLWLAPRTWHFENHKNADDANPYFIWSRVTTEGEGNSYILADICGVGTSINAFRFGHEIQGKGWKMAARSTRDDYADRLKSHGFSIFDNEKNPFYLPWQLDVGKLADAWMNDDYDELMEPLMTALNNLKGSVETFDKFMVELRSLVEK